MSRIFGEMRQIAFVVPDIDRAMTYWSETLGVGPFFIKRNIVLSDFQYYGKPAESPRISIALSNSGPMQIEFIQQHDDKPSLYRDFLHAGRHGLQHVAAWFTRAGFDERKRQLLAMGQQLAQEGSIASSGVRLAYFATDTKADGIVFEIADLLEPAQQERIAGIAEAARHWDGYSAVRDVRV